jgi:hypothetical protein
MRFFNIDFHISVITDIRTLLDKLGHQVDSLSLSNHNWVLGRRRDSVPALDGMSTTAFGQEECDRFYRVEREHLTEYDGFIVTHTPCLAGLYERTGKPVICVVSTRYDGFCQTPESRAWLESKLRVMHQSGQLILLANNAYDAWNVERNVGIRPEIVSSICDYTGVQWEGGKDPPFLAGRVDLPSLRRLPPGHSWQDVADSACVVTIPYNVSLMSVFERHAMGMPMLMPSGPWTLLHRETLSELSYSGIPDSEELEASVALSDWHGKFLPGITFFNSLEEIPAMLKAGLAPTAGQRERKEEVLGQWDRIVRELPGKLVSSAHPAPHSPETITGTWKWTRKFTAALYPDGVFAQVRDGNLEHRFGTWETTRDGFTLDLTGFWRKRIVLSTPEAGIWHLKDNPEAGGFIRKATTAVPAVWGRRSILTSDSYAELASEHTMVLHTDSVWEWYRRRRPKGPFTLITCHSDREIDEGFLPILEDPLLIRWHSMDVSVTHDKIRPIPLGAQHRLGLDSWLMDGRSNLTPLLYDSLLLDGGATPKTKVFNAAFAVGTNPQHREACLRAIGLPNRILGHSDFLIDLAQSRYCVSPEGNGIDCSRVWEALYCRTVPIITWNPMVNMGLYDGLPVIVLGRWEDFRSEDFTAERYERLMGDFDPACMTVERWIPTTGGLQGEEAVPHGSAAAPPRT